VFPLWDATVENGCLMIWPNSKEEGLLAHCPAFDGLQIPAKMVHGQPKSMPMKRGDVLFLHRLTMHASHSNVSDHVRWSLTCATTRWPTHRTRGVPGLCGPQPAAPRKRAARPSGCGRGWWYDTRSRLAAREAEPAFNRWSADSPVCA